ncbi:hypothetical protein HYH39_07890 [Clostridium botulinum]|nr:MULTISPECIES: hypothetical protein [unclassified Clostridium]KAI3348433.1 hypothetical protein CIT17_01145 [Clostridium botulinum]MBY6778864.1 hypothetical protein [Clostridium botulinum]MBY6803621.1 hypothetical protein [Clostridium botulinum]MBY6814166.1 hypothetical protein [Clostridium botulinum]MBY6820710.1 hypothetical protein [Clostridium botulinum]
MQSCAYNLETYPKDAKSPRDYENIFGIIEEDLENKWIKYTKENYSMA